MAVVVGRSTRSLAVIDGFARTHKTGPKTSGALLPHDWSISGRRSLCRANDRVVLRSGYCVVSSHRRGVPVVSRCSYQSSIADRGPGIGRRDYCLATFWSRYRAAWLVFHYLRALFARIHVRWVSLVLPVYGHIRRRERS